MSGWKKIFWEKGFPAGDKNYFPLTGWKNPKK